MPASGHWQCVQCGFSNWWKRGECTGEDATSREARIGGAGGADARFGRPGGIEDVLRADGVTARMGFAVGIASWAALARVCAAAPAVQRAQA